MVFLSVLFQYLRRMPHVLALLAKDLVGYLRHKRWEQFEYWGMHLYVGMFGAGKTCSMVNDAYRLAKQYRHLTIVTNLRLYHFPKHTQILPLTSPQDILNAPANTLVLIDEIGTIFNSRDFAAKQESVPKILFQHLCQQRKRHIMIYGTTQRWNFLDKQLRDITDTVRVTRSHLGHPFTRACTVYRYDAQEYDKAFANPLIPLQAQRGDVYVQTDACRQRYDTSQLISNILGDTYISDKEIAEGRGEVSAILATTGDKKAGRQMRRTHKKIG